MNATPVSDLFPADMPFSRRRLLRAYLRLYEQKEKGGWRELARRLGINVRYVYNYARYGKIPQNKIIRKKLLNHKPRIHIEPTRRVLTGAWRLHGRWVSPEEYFGARP